ncbi:tripartite tricarboxylate transporter TctB family protein [Neobacillus niacini]|uniref:tripartite tricarboxylate transporter TctB family protein n=1 Tax=Neobacillus niacini TaxID=86668 RepID=UPI0021CB0A66|nr:tripartite tricarboxylate transporter TctB family protein [Neobacillus niacini]MCM3763859.1 tripartite tricarboxylate transporter TctB family protein [Neobacillus niacini]
MKLPNIISGLLIMLVSGFFYAQTYQFPKVKLEEIGPAVMPRIYAAILFILGGIVVVQGLMAKKREEEENEKTLGYAVISMVFVLVFLILIPVIGFYISTALLVVGLLLFSKVRNYILLISVPVGTVLFIYVCFEKLLKVAIPAGSLFS